MKLFGLTINEAITIGSLIISVLTAAIVLKEDVRNVKDIVTELKVANEKIRESLDAVKMEQFRINMLVNFIYGEGIKSGWTPYGNWFDEGRDELRGWEPSNQWITQKDRLMPDPLVSPESSPEYRDETSYEKR